MVKRSILSFSGWLSQLFTWLWVLKAFDFLAPHLGGMHCLEYQVRRKGNLPFGLHCPCQTLYHLQCFLWLYIRYEGWIRMGKVFQGRRSYWFGRGREGTWRGEPSVLTFVWPVDLLCRDSGLSVLICLKDNGVVLYVTHSNIPPLANPWQGQDLENKECPCSFPGLLWWTNDSIAFPGS